MKIVFMGTPAFAVPCLEALLKAGHQIIGVFTQPDRPFGRKQVLKAPPVKEWAVEKGIEVYQPEKITKEENIEILKRLAPEIIVVVAYGQILSQMILDIPSFGCINVHASLLPKYRGAAPINWSIINGEKVTGVTTMFMEAGLDTGDIIMKKETLIGPDENTAMLGNRLSLMGAELILETLIAIEKGNAYRVPQINEESTYASMLNKFLSQIVWSKGASEIHDFVRGMNPWPIAWTFFDEKKVKIFRTSVTEEENQNMDAGVVVDPSEVAVPGVVYEVKKDGIVVNCGKGKIEIKELQFESGKRLEADVFLRGFEIKKGDKFL